MFAISNGGTTRLKHNLSRNASWDARLSAAWPGARSRQHARLLDRRKKRNCENAAYRPIRSVSEATAKWPGSQPPLSAPHLPRHVQGCEDPGHQTVLGTPGGTVLLASAHERYEAALPMHVFQPHALFSRPRSSATTASAGFASIKDWPARMVGQSRDSLRIFTAALKVGDPKPENTSRFPDPSETALVAFHLQRRNRN